MARNSTLDSLKADAQPVPAGVEVIQPPAELEAKLAREKLDLDRRGLTEMMAPAPGPRYPLIEQLPKVVQAEVVRPNAPVPVTKPVEAAKPNPDFRPVAKAPHDHEIVQAAHILVRKLCALSWNWEQKVQAMKSERSLSDEQICISLMANTLDTDAYLTIPVDHPYFNDQFEPAGRTVRCVICDNLLTTLYPGAPPVCVKDRLTCGIKWNTMSPEDKQELLEAYHAGQAG